MKAIILAAGAGKRLWEVTQHRPKCLIRIGSQTLLSRYMEALKSVGIRNVVVVVGYKQEMIREALQDSMPEMEISFVVNKQFHRGSISSLWEARHSMSDDMLVMDADVLFHRDILKRLVYSSHSSALCLDESVKQDTEECMAVVKNERVIALSKRVPQDYDYLGEGVGFLKVSRTGITPLIESVKAYVDREQWNMEYEDALVEFFEQVRVGYEKIGGLPWTEIDFPEDIIKAEQEILPQLSM